MDYYTKNEFGDLIPTTDTNIGIPTKGYYAFEIYDTDESWNGRRVANGGFNMPILPGIRIPSTRDGDVNLGGWGGTWGGLFEYDLLNHKRLFYTVKTIHTKHNRQNVLLPGDTVGYFPEFNKNKSAAYWNFPITIDSAKKYDEPTIIGSVLIPRISVKNASSSDGSLYRPYKIINEPYISASDSYNEQIQDCENYLGLGVKLIGGKNSGDVFTDLFTANNFIINGQNIFGDKDTWNYGDNSVIPFTSTLFAIEMGKKSGAITNGFNVHSAYNHVVNDQSTYGAFINSSTGKNKESILEILIYNITDELPYLIKDKVYSSFNKGSLNVNSGSLDTIALGGDATSIYVEDSTTNIVNNNRNTDNNAYNGQFYYFGLWKEANALYDIESNYAI
jgi:hypothetical protein